MLEYFERDQVPGDVRTTLASALNGDLQLFERLCNAMIDSWPKLQKNINEVARLVSIAPWKVLPYAPRGEKPDAAAEKLAKEIEDMIWTMRPNAQRMERGLEGTIKDLALGYYYGHAVSEIHWRNTGGDWKPKATRSISARFYGYPEGFGTDDGADRLMLDPTGGWAGRRFVDFPENRFLVAVNSGHRGHPAMAAPLRALAAYWLAAVYGLKWFVNFAQLYGIPWRHAEVANATDRDVVSRALATIGSKGYIVTEPGTKINVLDGRQSGQSLPQRELLKLADEQCDVFVLGQTLTSGTADSGSRALGEVHDKTKNDMVDAVADFVGEVLTYQFIPALVSVNWGERDDIPQMWAKREERKDEKAKAERMEILKRIGIPMGKAYVHEELGVPVPSPDEELFQTASDGAQGDPATGAGNPHETKARLEDPERKPGGKVEAADAWRAFEAGTGTLGIPRREMPQIQSGNRAAMVRFLQARGVEARQETVDPDTLKPTQAEYSPDKVAAAKRYTGGNRAILISADGHVVDGHHQWLAALEAGEPIRVIRLMAPITRVLMMVHRMPSTTVAAADAGAEEPMTVDKLSAAVLEGLTGVSREWLSPVRPYFERLAALAMAKQVTDEDFLAALEKGRRELPELFDVLDTEALEEAFEDAIGSAMLAGSVSRYER